MEEFLTLEDVLREASRLGLELSERTFRYYAVLGLLPRPVKRPSGDARVHYYPSDIMTRLKDIRGLQNQGYSLKQIKGYFAVTPLAAETAPASPESRPAVPRPLAQALLEAFAQNRPRQAARRFLVRCQNRDEESFREAALEYYAELLALVAEPASARASINEALGSLSPLEVERVLHPLREWRDREEARKRSGGLALTRRLRQLALDRLSGQPNSSAELKGYARTLQVLAGRAREQAQDPDPVVRRASARIVRALEQLGEGCRLQDPAALLGEIAEAERSLAEMEQLLRLYASL